MLKKTEESSKIRIGLVTSAKRKCGIASYSAFLTGALKELCQVEEFALPEVVSDSTITSLVRKINRSSTQIVHIQHTPGLFGGDRQSIRYLNNFITLLNSSKKVVITLHEAGRGERIYKRISNVHALIRNARDFYFNTYYSQILNRRLVDILQRVEKIIVHSQYQKDFLVQNGVLCHLIEVIAHGVPPLNGQRGKNGQLKSKYELENKFILSTFGFTKDFKNYESVLHLNNL